MYRWLRQNPFLTHQCHLQIFSNYNYGEMILDPNFQRFSQRFLFQKGKGDGPCQKDLLRKWTYRKVGGLSLKSGQTVDLNCPIWFCLDDQQKRLEPSSFCFWSRDPRDVLGRPLFTICWIRVLTLDRPLFCLITVHFAPRSFTFTSTPVYFYNFQKTSLIWISRSL